MKTNYFLCLSLNCKNKVERHPLNFEDGFCGKCKEEKNEIVYNQFLKTN